MTHSQAARGGDSSPNNSKTQCIDCNIDLNGMKIKSISCGFRRNNYCQKCSKLRAALFNDIGKEESIMWTCSHCRIAMPGVHTMMAQITKLEAKVGQIEEKLNGPVLPKAEKELIQEVIREEKEEETEMEQRRLNLVLHQLSESNQGTLEDRKRDDSETVSSLLTEALNVDVEIENVFHLGAAPRDKEKSRPIRFTVSNMDNKRRILDSSKNLKNVEGYSNVYFTPDLTRNQRRVAFELREEKRRRMAAGERDLVIRRGKIIQQKPKPSGEDHTYVTPLRDRPAAAETGGARFSDRSRSPPGNSQRGGSFH